MSGIFRPKGASPTSDCWCRKTIVIDLSCGVKISAVHCFILSQRMCVTDGQTDRQNYPPLPLEVCFLKSSYFVWGAFWAEKMLLVRAILRALLRKNMFVFSPFTSRNAPSLREAQIGQHITPCNIMQHFVTVCTICYLLLSWGHWSLLRLL